MRDEVSDPLAAPEPPRPIVESIPPDEPKTPSWLTWVGFTILLAALGWLAVRCSSDEARAPSAGSASAQRPQNNP